MLAGQAFKSYPEPILFWHQPQIDIGPTHGPTSTMQLCCRKCCVQLWFLTIGLIWMSPFPLRFWRREILRQRSLLKIWVTQNKHSLYSFTLIKVGRTIDWWFHNRKENMNNTILFIISFLIKLGPTWTGKNLWEDI